MIFGTFSSTSHIAVFYPNQSGWRFLGFPIWVILLLIFRNTPLKRAAFCLGCGCGALLLANLETGIVMTIGTMVFLVSRAQHVAWRERANHALLFFGGALVAMFTFWALFRAEFDQWPFSLSTLAADTLLHHFCQGYGGRPLVCDLMAAFIFMHCVYLVSSLILRWRDRGISHSAGVKLAVAAAVLTWYAYYMNRPDPWNLWTFLFLYSFLMADFLDRRRLTLTVGGAGACLLLPTFASQR